MDQNQIVIVVVVVVIAIIVVAAIGYVSSRKRRSRKLREHFGPEYERVLKQEGDPRKAEGVLEFREKRREKFKYAPSRHRTGKASPRGGEKCRRVLWMIRVELSRLRIAW